MSDKQLPTRETAIAVRPESIPTPEGKTEKRTAFVILGTTRSGTSVTAGIMHRLGVVMGWELQSEDGNPRFDWPDPTPMNPVGFFQDAPLENAQDAVWGDDYPQEGAVATRQQSAEFRRLIKARCERGHQKWGFKAHRTPWLISELVESCSDSIKFVITERNIDVSSASLHHWFPEYGKQRCDEWLRRASTQIRNVLLDSRYADIPRLVVKFNDLMGHPAKVINEIAEFLDVPVTQEAICFVDNSLNRMGEHV